MYHSFLEYIIHVKWFSNNDYLIPTCNMHSKIIYKDTYFVHKMSSFPFIIWNRSIHFLNNNNNKSYLVVISQNHYTPSLSHQAQAVPYCTIIIHLGN